MKSKVRRVLRGQVLRLGLILGAVLGTLFLYQNCARVNFEKSAAIDQTLSMSSVSASPTMVIEDGAVATSKKILKISFKNGNRAYNEMRLSAAVGQLEKQNWIAYADEASFDLNSAWAQDGSKDGLKNIYAQFRDNANPDVVLSSEGSINLDTLAPEVLPVGLLKDGLRGEIFSKGQEVSLSWTVADKNQLSEYISGMDGVRFGYALSADCSEANVKWQGAWGPVKTEASLAWPVASPVDSFYVCILARDLAGNTSSFLSQPLTGLWKVFAGDNNQGNGGSATARNVRFGKPYSIGIDSKKNIYISDANFNNLRRVRSDGIIELVMGQGPAEEITEGSTFKSNIAGGTSQLYFDSSDRAYFVKGNVFRISKDTEGVETVKKIINLDKCNIALSIIKKKTGDMMLIHNLCSSIANDSASKSLNYLVMVPISYLDKQSSAVDIRSLVSQFKFLGSGTISKDTYVHPLEMTLSKSDPEGDAHSLSSPKAIDVDTDGTIYLLTQSNFNAASGARTVRRLIPKGNGTYLQQMIARAPTHANNIRIKDGKLYMSSDDLYSFDLKQIDGKKLQAPTAISIPSIKNISDFSVNEDGFYFADDYSSRIFIADNQLNIHLKLGRPTYSSLDLLAESATLSRPQGIVQTSSGNTYFVDMLNQLIRKVDINGQISTVAGNVNAAVQTPKSYTGEDFSAFEFGLISDSAGGGFMYLDAFFDQSSKSDKLFLADRSVVQRLDVKTKKVKTIAGTPVAASYLTRNTSPIEEWALGGIQLIKASGGQRSLMMNRNLRYNSATRDSLRYGLMTSLSLDGSSDPASKEAVIMGDANVEYGAATAGGASIPLILSSGFDLPVYGISSIREDSSGFAFFSGGGFYATRVNDSNHATHKIKVNKSGVILSAFEMYEEGNIRHIFGLSGNSLIYFKFDVRGLFGSEGLSVTTERLCLPGTFWNNPRGITSTVDGNLLISDESNARILKYFIRDSAGKIKTVACN